MGITQDKFLKKIMLDLKNGLLIVEGKNDLAALEELGVAGNVILANGQNEQIVQKALFQLEPKQKLILLFDLDAEGERKTVFFKEKFFNEGMAADTEMRHKVRALFGITTMEELPTAYFRLMDEIE